MDSKIKLIATLFLFSLFSSLAYGFRVHAVSFQMQKVNNKPVVHVQVSKGYGVQKNGKHTFDIYELSSSSKKYNEIKDKVKNAGTKIDSLSNVSGQTALQDENYYDKINPIIFKNAVNPNKSYAFVAKVFVCSFANGFCSVQREYLLFP